MTEHHSPPKAQAPNFFRTRYVLGLVVMGAIAAYFLLSEHRAHFIGALPLLLLLACPLMHVFMHNGHDSHGGGHAGHQDTKATPARPTSTTGEQP
ncbi:MAG: DUF2933 domain-containing protein [Acidovorax sp.]|jgi:hypothetical protein|uniref:DUF2933 domain-containing protein n=1 Tax=unclassified Acidovorax TaxID=2684926 RepID=UPI00023FD178|nr:DUF2933 domain-containing protein [Acidovorax sp. NO-1]EHL22401.1 hypothetical protein KYG_13296 [Acidovorax sp. NO-1]MDP3230279.1 DUF2933 domain-containing protein [Acidovorax sp.]